MDRLPLPIVKHVILPDLLLVSLITTQPSTAIRFVGFCTFAFLCLTSVSFTTGNATQDYFVGFLSASQVLLAVDLLWLIVPLDALRHERDMVLPRDMPLWRRAYWAFCLNHSVRAIGWTHQVNNVPPHPREPRWLFVRSRLIRTVCNFLVADVANTYILHMAGTDINSWQTYALPVRCSTITAWICLTCGTLNAQYYSLSAMSVGLGMSLPRDWPDLFGKWTDAYTLRKFWGKVWHQNFRRLFTPVGKFIARIFGFKRGTNASSYTQLYTAFFLSSLIHGAGDLMVDRKYAGSSIPFFISQAVAITAEDTVIALCRSVAVSSSRLTRLVGYIWVFVWATLTFSMYRDLAVEAGWGWSSEWPFSPAGLLWKAFHD
ncbi:hypothetical protein EW146_g1769 [Bondarzewia mesenterica]|uniref:Wax synthase domain-containing protein n=1 Tax=Bondarzewia mesenterica TaxID=1095465 RepID=A0A4S4M2V7_9AGAM|nr:hypothetical protein EW146_g1769 [Bondarzewia mesenterica]